jgi:uncharacterized protein YecE (DUF72 family)
VEVDSTFYAIIPSPKTVRGWAARVPDGSPISRRAFSIARELGPKLGLILINSVRTSGLPRFRLLSRSWSFLPRDVRFVIEFRQRGWIDRRVLSTLANHYVALALADGRWIPRTMMLIMANNRPPISRTCA